MFQFWFNTFFTSGLEPKPSEGEASMFIHTIQDKCETEGLGAMSWFELHKEDLDKANKDKKNKIYAPDFKVRFIRVSQYLWSLVMAMVMILEFL